MPEHEHARRIWRLCQACARSVYTTKPSAAYADRVARLLFGTAAQESGLRWERQRTPRWEGNVGGFSKWQLETGSIDLSRAMLRSRPALLTRATDWLFADPRANTTWVNVLPLEYVLWAMRLDDNDKIGVLFARLHYMRVRPLVPASLVDQAAYWKRWYNTPAGKGTAQQYLANWRALCAEVVDV